MNLEKVIFGFFLILALTLNVAFVFGAETLLISGSVWIMFTVIVVNIIATILKLGDRSQVGAILLSSSLVATLLLISSRIVWIVVADPSGNITQTGSMEAIVSLGYGALLANIVSVTILVGDTLMSRR